MIGFYCVTAFQIFLTVLLKYCYFKNQKCVIFLASPLVPEDYNLQVFYDLGFEKIIIVNRDDEEQGKEIDFEKLFFFSIYCAHSRYLKKLKTKCLALVYEGITTYQLKHWCECDIDKRFNIDTDIDEIWLPNLNLLLDKEYLHKCKQFTVDFNKLGTDVENICECLNRIFYYTYQPVYATSVFMDRYLKKFVHDITAERMLTQNVYYGIKGEKLIKRHPGDEAYEEKYMGLEGLEVIKENVPWELIYLNNRLRNKDFKVTEYIIYNSFAPANMALLFNEPSFKCVCVDDILINYGNISNTYLNADITRNVLDLLSEEYGVEVQYISDLEELWGIREESFCTKNALWEEGIKAIKEVGTGYFSELKVFRLQLDSVLISIRKQKGTYYLNADNYCAQLTRRLLRKVLPDYLEVHQKEADFIVDCNKSLVNYATQEYDVRKIRIIEGCFHLSEEEERLEKLIRCKKFIYIWGATNTNQKTFSFLQKVNLYERVDKVFDTYATGENHGFTIVPFTPQELKSESVIIICAQIAYPEITQKLQGLGYKENIDFVLGIDIARKKR